MFRANTVLILGAGASSEVGLPVGSELLAQVCRLLDIEFDAERLVRGDAMIVNALIGQLEGETPSPTWSRYLDAARQIISSSRQALSIDNVIDALEDPCVELVGKLAIARAILKAEEESAFFKSPKYERGSIDLDKFLPTWYSHLSKLLTENVRKSQVDSIFHSLEIINFNYDRCLEQYLPFSLANYYGIPVRDAQTLTAGLVVHRAYGVVGELPWQRGGLPKVPFGAATSEDIVESARQVRTFTEQVEEGTHLADIRRALAHAERIVFLGFAFHRQNLALLGMRPFSGDPDVIATAFGVSAADRHVIQQEVATAFELEAPLPQEAIELADLTCHDLFRDYWRTLTAEPPFR
jgi:hypothetical protein